MTTPESTVSAGTATDADILNFPTIDKTRLIASKTADQVEEDILEIGAGPDAEQATDDILKIVEQTLPGKRKTAILAAASAFRRMENSAAATALSGLFLKTALGQGLAWEENQRLISDHLRRLGTPEALFRLKAVVAPHAPKSAVSAIAHFDAPEVPEIIASIAIAQSAQGRVTGLQPLALTLLTKLHAEAKDGKKSFSADSVKAAADYLSDAITFTLPKSLRGGEQYRLNVLDYRDVSELRPEMSDVSQLSQAFDHAKKQEAISRPIPYALENMPILDYDLN